MKTKTNIKSGRIALNHNQTLKVKTSVRAGGIRMQNHNQSLKVKTSVRAGKIATNHNQAFAC